VTPGDDDAALLAAHVAGDPDAFAQLVRRHQDRLWAVALRTMGDREEASDAVQEALLSAFRRAETFRGDAQVSTWLHRIVVNACLDRLRRQKSRAADPLPEDEDRLGAIGGRSGTEDPAEAGERRTDVLAALAQLSADQRTAVVLVDMEGYSVDEVAELMDCAPGTIKSRCARGRARLVPLLAQYRRRPAPTAEPGGNPTGPSSVQPMDPSLPPTTPTESGRPT
jgi:RNA polymerase sigma-70 factor (ECF subfamily)